VTTPWDDEAASPFRPPPVPAQDACSITSKPGVVRCRSEVRRRDRVSLSHDQVTHERLARRITHPIVVGQVVETSLEIGVNRVVRGCEAGLELLGAAGANDR